MMYSVAVRFIIDIQAENLDDAKESIHYELMKHFGEDQTYEVAALPAVERRNE